MTIHRESPPATDGASPVILIAALVGVLVGAAAWLFGARGVADIAWAAAIVVALVPLTVSVARELARRKTGVDVIALLAMAGSLALGQFLAGAIVAVMLSGGEALERYAAGRARRELSALLARAPQIVHRYEGGVLVAREVPSVRKDDVLLVKPGEVIAVDGTVVSPLAVLDESALTGEAMPVEHVAGEEIRSGSLNLGTPFDMRATATSEASTYAGIVRLVREAQASKAPFVRLADRFAVWFLPLTLAMAALAWLVSGDAVRALAVLVIATPCPLILAAPIAIVAGISRAAHRGVIVKGGGALETLGQARTLVFDKTGTLTQGLPRVGSIAVFGPLADDELLRLAASVDQMSPHVFADGIVAAATEKKLRLDFPTDVVEHHGLGIEGVVGGRRVALGQLRWLSGRHEVPAGAQELRKRLANGNGAASVFVAIDGVVTGALVMEDPVRLETPDAIRSLRRAGVSRIVLLSGDRKEVAQAVGNAIGVDEVLYEHSAEQKTEAVARERRAAVSVMVGDGINDAPALAAADVGIAMGARGATASSEAADAVIVVDRLDRVAEAISIAHRSRSIAVQSVVAGMALSFAGMVAAAFGALPPVAGAFLQEAIDVAVIVNALRALGGGHHA